MKHPLPIQEEQQLLFALQRKSPVLCVILSVCVDWLTSYYFINFRRYEADLEDKNNTSFTTRSVNSGVTFPKNSKEDSKRTGSYELQSRQMNASLSPQSRTSGDYDYPDPQPAGTRESFPYYDNPGLQRDHAQ